MTQDAIPSTRPYLIRAMHEWCVDNGYTPYIAVAVDDGVQVPREFVKDNEIVLNASHEATSHLTLGKEFIEFKARFAGVARAVVIPVDNVTAVYARENGHGMAFAAPALLGEAAAVKTGAVPASAEPGLHMVPTVEALEGGGDKPAPPAGGVRPALRRVK